jgi:hypothetical protein
MRLGGGIGSLLLGGHLVFSRVSAWHDKSEMTISHNARLSVGVGMGWVAGIG